MTTRLQREWIYEAKRTGLRNRIRDEWGVSEALGDAMLQTWEVQAQKAGLTPDDPRYWSDAVDWMDKRLLSRCAPHYWHRSSGCGSGNQGRDGRVHEQARIGRRNRRSSNG
jgi:hypothetical protein